MLNIDFLDLIWIEVDCDNSVLDSDKNLTIDDLEITWYIEVKLLGLVDMNWLELVFPE